MKQAVLAVVAAAVVWLGVIVGAARAQDAWVQIEALPTLARAEERARAWAAVFPDVHGFRLPSGWYAIALGPYDPGTAADRLFALRAERLIPGDSFVADGGQFRARFWPAGAAAAGEPAAGAEAPAGAAAAPGAGADAPGAAAPPDPAAAAVAGSDAASAPAPGPGAAPDPGADAAPAAAAPEPDETPAEARRSEARLTAEDRRALQAALEWFGFYDAAIDGAFGRGTRAAMEAWQAANGHPATGVLTERQRAELLAAYAADREGLGLAELVEERAGIALTMPLGLVTFANYAPPFVRFEPRDGSGVQVLLISQEGDEATLAGLYDLMQTLEIVPVAGFRERQRTSFTLTGQSERLESHTFARLEGGMIKGFTLVWPPGDRARMDRVVAVMRETLRSTGPALDPTLGAAGGAERRDLLAGLEVRQAARTRSGFWVDARGAALTVAEAVEGCARVTLDDVHEAEVAASDGRLVLLRPRAPLSPRGVAELARDEPRIGARAAVGGFPFGPVLPVATVSFGRFEALAGLGGEADLLRLQVTAEAGEAGGPVFDPEGRVAGVLLPADGTGAAGRILPPGVRFALKAAPVGAFLAAQGVALPAAAAASGGDRPLAPEDITARAMAVTVLVSCWN
jgi:peptidoglycan hydrolase-like protein with peptidoglycan-binding domain